MLRELQENCNLTNQECADANAAALKEETAPREIHARTGLITWRIRVLLVISLAFLGLIGCKARTTQIKQPMTAAVHVPVTLIDEVEHLPALAWKAIPVSLPYGGMVKIDIRVRGGNPIDVSLMNPDQLDPLEKMEWDNLKVYGDFAATHTKTYSHAGPLAQGGYYLVVRDMTLGIPSSFPSDLSVKVQLNPSDPAGDWVSANSR